MKNTGRCAELLIPGAVIYVQESGNPARKTKWDLIAVEKGERLDQYGLPDPEPGGKRMDRTGEFRTGCDPDQAGDCLQKLPV